MTVKYDPTPIVGYGEGLVTGDAVPVREDNNDWIYIGEYVFNVHPYRSDLKGWPVRWIDRDKNCRGVLGRHIGIQQED